MARNRPINHAAVSGPENPAAGAPKAIATRPFKVQLLIIFAARTTVSTAIRLVYPFLPSIARGLGIPLATASRLVTLRMVGGVAAPLLGLLADRYGRRRVMEVALLLFALAGLLMAGLGTLAAAAVAFTLYGFAKALYDPAIHAYVGDEVPYDERGRAVGIVELSWSSAWLLGVPASGVLIERFGWRAPWAALIVLGLVGPGLTRAILPPAYRPAGRQRAGSLVASMVATWRALLRRRPVLVLLATSFLFTSAIEIPFIVYGAWLETAFGLSLRTLGLASTVVGVAEAAAEFGTAVITDRLGKKRSVLVGGWLWQWQSIALNAGVGALCALVGALLLVWGMTEVAQSTRGSRE